MVFCSIDKNVEWFATIFNSIMPWSTKFMTRNKKVWVKCRIILISRWSESCFQKAVATMGTMMAMDNRTKNLEELKYVRNQVKNSLNRKQNNKVCWNLL